MQISTFNVNKFQGAYCNPSSLGGYYNRRNIDFKTPIYDLLAEYLKDKNDIIFMQEFYDDINVQSVKFFQSKEYEIYANMLDIKTAKSNVVAMTLKDSLWERIEPSTITQCPKNKFIEMKLEDKKLHILSFHNTSETIKTFVQDAFSDNSIILGDFNDRKWLNQLRNEKRYKHLINDDMITYKPAQTSIDGIFIPTTYQEKDIIFKGVIETYVSDHNFLSFTLNL